MFKNWTDLHATNIKWPIHKKRPKDTGVRGIRDLQKSGKNGQKTYKNGHFWAFSLPTYPTKVRFWDSSITNQFVFFNYRTISEMVERTADDSLDSYFALCKKSSTKSSGLSQRSMLSYRFAIKQIEADNYFVCGGDVSVPFFPQAPYCTIIKLTRIGCNIIFHSVSPTSEKLSLTFSYMYFSIGCPNSVIILSSSIASRRALCVSL